MSGTEGPQWDLCPVRIQAAHRAAGGLWALLRSLWLEGSSPSPLLPTPHPPPTCPASSGSRPGSVQWREADTALHVPRLAARLSCSLSALVYTAS